MEIWDSRIRHSETQPFGATGPTIKKKQDTIKLDEQHYLQNRNMKTRIFPEKKKNKQTKEPSWLPATAKGIKKSKAQVELNVFMLVSIYAPTLDKVTLANWLFI